MSVPPSLICSDWPNMRHLRLLDLAAQDGSLTKAARAVHISQPAASQAIAKLARVFDAPLLERVGNAVTLTPEGQIVTERARRALAHLQDPALFAKGRARQASADLLERYASITQLRVMALFALTGSFPATARGLGQTEASVQRAAKDIEQIIGQPVLEGGRRSRALNAVGQNIARRASLALREIELAHADLRARKGLFDSRLVIGALPLARTRLVPRAVLRLLEKYPFARIEILDGAYEFLLQRLRLGACDLIVGALRDDVGADDLLEAPLLSDSLRLVARAGHPFVGAEISGPELGQFPWIVPRRDAPARRVFEAFAQRHGLGQHLRGHVETGSLVVLRGILLESDALALISPNQIRYELEQGLLVTLDIPVPGSARAIGVTALRTGLPGRLHLDFLEFLAQEVARSAASDGGFR
ncbi:MAG: LysR family transcriptional regulator [Roseinatronobacter sp.]|jgi:LysR family transcriptional regulator, regulator for genes of the gallate degradation pathway|nr:LysR family transcriptional regulator [Roseinatronobacter sp.]